MSRTELRLEMIRLAGLADKAHAKGKVFKGSTRRPVSRKKVDNCGWVVRLGTSPVQPQTVKP